MRPSDVVRFLHLVQRRRLYLDLLIAATVSLSVFAAVGFVSRHSLAAIGVAAAAGVLTIVHGRRHRTAAAAARAVERAHPQSRNLVVTAEELFRHPDRASERMVARVMDDASHAVADLRAAQLLPAGRTLTICGVATAVAISLLLAPRFPEATRAISRIAGSAVDTVLGRTPTRLTVSIQPPAYSGLPARSMTDPERIDVLEGSRLTFAADGGPLALRFGVRPLGTLTDGSAGIEVVARESGYFAVEGHSRALIPLAVAPDRAPVVTIEQPARDLLLPDGNRTVPLRVAASDDLALAALEIRYTKMSGSGETYEFNEGSIPVRVDAASGRDWRGRAEVSLGALGLAAGESLIYRAVARDRRGGASGVGTSETFFIEIAGPGQVPLEGVEMPPGEERYALSQQMIVLKIERLRARERAMPREAVAEEAALLAAEQRSVRANFVFLLGGHVEDEEVEAEQSHEIAEGRLENTARRDINAAIGEMTRAEQGLVAASTAAALPPARAAVEALQRAFGRSRYLLRALPLRSRIDPSRRLAGNTETARPWTRSLPAVQEREGDAARALLAGLLDLSAAVAAGASGDTRRIDALAEQAIAVEPSSPVWQELSSQILELRQHASRPAAANSALERVIERAAVEAGKGLVPTTPLAVPKSPLQRAWEGGGAR